LARDADDRNRQLLRAPACLDLESRSHSPTLPKRHMRNTTTLIYTFACILKDG